MQKIRIMILAALMVLVMGIQALAAPSPDKIVLEKNHSTYLDLWGMDSVAVGNPEIADVTVVSNREILIVAKGQGSTSLQVKFKSGNRRTYSIVVTDSDRAVSESIEAMMNYPNVTVSKVGENIVLDGTVEDQIEKKRAETIAKMFGKSVVNLLEMENPKQIKIEAKIVEIDSDKVDKIGVQYFNASSVTVDETSGFRTVKQGSTGNFGMGQSYGKGAYGWFGDYASINANLMLMITQGHAKVLSQPNIVTMSGEKAHILIGGEIPLPISNADGQVSVEWREYGIKLEIEPNVGVDQQINGKINAEVSSLDSNAAVAINANSQVSIPALRSRKAETVITLKSGNTMAIGGLISSDDSKQVMKVPILGDLPILGQFFRSTSKNKERKEIIILVTPTLVTEETKTPMSYDLKNYISDKVKEQETLAKSPEERKADEKAAKEKAAQDKVKAEQEKEKAMAAEAKAKEQKKLAADKAKQQEQAKAKEKAELEKMQQEQAKADAEKLKKEQAQAEKVKKEQEKAAKKQAEEQAKKKNETVKVANETKVTAAKSPEKAKPAVKADVEQQEKVEKNKK